ncbi:protein kinase [Streptomyces tubbatahanensis]|uniref:non-specific serine/threonine protein kinase n=1 Tax=Streptomyces tubbatahanensis TaxID=2923272 RepID=A0ABY3XU15_9ACTN|nr:Stk1 family PASTA domain-containing Ser/Thr kinase [Streptomyces tubbatahanensis]UNS97978.1 protein kinase [Streptomyces tubbatahanensis]
MSDDGAQAAGNYLGRMVGGGRFQLRSLLGAGGMASVYLAYDSVLDRQVAVKTLHTELGREQSFRERFRREAQSVAKLTHTNIVSVFDSGEDEIDGALVPYIVMEYVEGKPLRTVLDEDIAQHGAMPADKALKITGDVLAALEVSHEMGLVHRDIKPGNVMLTKRGVVKVMDFGIARAMQSGVTSMTQTGMVVGTPQYLSPEQALGRGVDARSDLYSVGIMLFELLTGRLPFDADSPLAIAYAHVQEEPVSPSSINQSIPAAVDALVARTLKKNPNERFPSADSMHDEVTRIGGSGLASGASPIIISGGPSASGAGVGQAVFPPVDANSQPQQGGAGVQMPYQPPQGHGQVPGPGQVPGQGQGQGQPGPYNSGGFGPSTPPPHAQNTAPAGYGYPQSSYGTGGPSTPPPYTINAAGGSGQGNGGGPGKKMSSGAMAGYGLAAVAVIVALVFVIINLTGDSGGDDPEAKPTTKDKPTASADPGGSEGGDSGDSGSNSGGFKGPDKSRTIDKEKCTDATETYEHNGNVMMPDMTYKDLTSVKACLRAAGWKLGDVTMEDENVFGKNQVLDQNPGSLDDFNPKKDEVDLTVSTGQPGS